MHGLPLVIESVGELGQRVEKGFQWPVVVANDRLLGAWRALISASDALEASHRRVAVEMRIVKAMLRLE